MFFSPRCGPFPFFGGWFWLWQNTFCANWNHGLWFSQGILESFLGNRDFLVYVGRIIFFCEFCNRDWRGFSQWNAGIPQFWRQKQAYQGSSGLRSLAFGPRGGEGDITEPNKLGCTWDVLGTCQFFCCMFPFLRTKESSWRNGTPWALFRLRHCMPTGSTTSPAVPLFRWVAWHELAGFTSKCRGTTLYHISYSTSC